ncbi:MAG: SoxY-related AACIE arm protein [Pseudomonadota bacterium]
MRTDERQALSISRRSLITGVAGLGTLALIRSPAAAAPEDVIAAQRALFGDREIQTGRVMVTMPPIAENGFSVPFEVEVDSPMTEDDHVVQIAVFSPRNPLPDMARFHLGPRAGRARVATRIRMSGTQAITAVAEMSDGSLWSGSAETVVTLAACIIL